MKKYEVLLPNDKIKKSERIKIDFQIENNSVVVYLNINNNAIRFGDIDRIGDKFSFKYLNHNDIKFDVDFDYLIQFIKFWIEDYFTTRDLYFPRIYINSARALSDSNLWGKLQPLYEKFYNEGNIDRMILTRYAMSSLITGAAINSYLAIESFANETLVSKIGIEDFNILDNDINQKSLKEKLKKLCVVLNINKIQDHKVWNDFQILDDVRNKFVHYKQDNFFDILYDYKTKINPSFLLNTGLDVIKFYYKETNKELNDYLKGNLFFFTDIEVLYD